MELHYAVQMGTDNDTELCQSKHVPLLSDFNMYMCIYMLAAHSVDSVTRLKEDTLKQLP